MTTSLPVSQRSWFSRLNDNFKFRKIFFIFFPPPNQEAESDSLRRRLSSLREKCAQLEEEAVVARAQIKGAEVEAEELKKVNFPLTRDTCFPKLD